jgi:hypothetical protein
MPGTVSPSCRRCVAFAVWIRYERGRGQPSVKSLAPAGLSPAPEAPQALLGLVLVCPPSPGAFRAFVLQRAHPIDAMFMALDRG